MNICEGCRFASCGGIGSLFMRQNTSRPRVAFAARGLLFYTRPGMITVYFGRWRFGGMLCETTQTPQPEVPKRPRKTTLGLGQEYASWDMLAGVSGRHARLAVLQCEVPAFGTSCGLWCATSKARRKLCGRNAYLGLACISPGRAHPYKMHGTNVRMFRLHRPFSFSNRAAYFYVMPLPWGTLSRPKRANM